MPIQYSRDDAAALITLTVTAPVSLADAVRMAERQIVESTWAYRLLIDARLATISMADNFALLDYMRDMAARHGPPGPMALVARDAATLGPAQVYAMLAPGRTGRAAEVFWDVGEAREWLRRQPLPVK
jgi:hypothetical protein